jgi:hypothetical protein
MTVKTIQYPVNIAEPVYVELKSLAKRLGTSVSKLILKSIEEKYNLQAKVITIKAPQTEGILVEEGDEFNYKLIDSEAIKSKNKQADYDRKDLYYTANRYSY